VIQAFNDMSGSKKAIVFVLTALLMAAVIFGGVDTEAANEFTDKLYKLAMAYLGGQGLADLGKYAGEAWKSGKKAVDSRDDRPENPDEWIERLEKLEELDQDKIKRLGKLFENLDEKASKAAIEGEDPKEEEEKQA